LRATGTPRWLFFLRRPAVSSELCRNEQNRSGRFSRRQPEYVWYLLAQGSSGYVTI
jgi:hypothetical protein